MLECADKRIMIVCGDSGLGKSSLVAKMMHECGQRGLRKAEVVWTDTRPHDYLGLMRKVRDDLDPAAFCLFSDLANFFTANNYELVIKVEGAERIRVAEGAHVERSVLGDVAGIVVKDFMINAPRSDMAVPEAERRARLTDQFVGDLKTFLARERVVVFLDAVEKMSADTRAWLWNELLTPVRDAALDNLVVVLCGQGRPDLDRDWELCVEVAEVQPLRKVDVVEYLAKRGIGEEHRSELGTMLLAMTGGRVAEIAKAVDAFLRLQARSGEER
jgi:archaellum biogenesis ATPase FlaH